jgi:biotin synthase
MRFDAAGRLVDCGFNRQALEAIIQTGESLQTSGCPVRQDGVSACNRPYGDSMPADIRSFPFALNTLDVESVRRQMQGDDIVIYGGMRGSAAHTLTDILSRN